MPFIVEEANRPSDGRPLETDDQRDAWPLVIVPALPEPRSPWPPLPEPLPRSRSLEPDPPDPLEPPEPEPPASPEPEPLSS